MIQTRRRQPSISGKGICILNIFVCVKQVPATNKVEVDEKTGVLKRGGVLSKMNPYDLYAIETALRLKEEYGAETAALTMGPPYGEAVLREAMMMGIACISTKVAGSTEIIQSMDNGILTDIGDRDALTKAMLMLAEDDALRDKLQKNAAITAEQFKTENIIAQWEDLI